MLFTCWLVSPSFSAEFLVRAKPHWKDSWNATAVNKLSVQEKRNYDARTQVGDVIVVRPDGWEWGKEECLPNFIIIKIPGLNYDTAKQYEDALHEAADSNSVLKFRKWQIPKTFIDAAIAQGQSVVVIDSPQVTVFINRLIQKTQ